MAEFVQRRKEEWGPIFQESIRLDLLTPAEQRQFVAEIEDKEYGVQKTARKLEDLFKWVDCVEDFLSFLKKRRKELHEFEKNKEIEAKIVSKIRSMFGVYERDFLEDMRYWQRRLRFEKTWCSTMAVLEVFEKAITKCGAKYPVFYEKASSYQWSLRPLENIKTARELLQKGLRMVQPKIKFYLWLYELEMRHADYLLNLQDETENSAAISVHDYQAEAKKSLAVADVIFCDALKDKECLSGEPDLISLASHFVEIVLKYQRTRAPKLEYIFQKLQKVTSKHESVHILQARVEFRLGNLESGIARIWEGLVLVPEPFSFLSAAKLLFEAVQSKSDQLLWSNLAIVLDRGLENDKLCAESFKLWLDAGSFLNAQGSLPTDKDSIIYRVFCPERRLEVLQKATKKNRTDGFFLSQLICVELQRKRNSTELAAFLDEMFPAVQIAEFKDGDYSMVFRVLLAALQFTDPCANPEKQYSILSRVLNKSPLMSAMFLNYVQMTDGIQAARSIRSKMAHQDSYSVLKALADMEFTYVDHSSADKFKSFREVMERLCYFHGKNILDVWVDYMTFEKRLNNAVKVSEIYHRGLATLKGTPLSENLMLAYKTLHSTKNKSTLFS